MKYLTHTVLHHQPQRALRDSFGLDSAACWCVWLTSPATPAARLLAKATPLQHSHECQTKQPKSSQLALHPEFSFENVVRTGNNDSSTASESIEGIQLRDLAHSRSPSHSTSGTPASDPPSPSPAHKSPTWLTPPPPPIHNPSHSKHRPPIPLNNLPPLPPTPTSTPPPQRPSQ